MSSYIFRDIDVYKFMQKMSLCQISSFQPVVNAKAGGDGSRWRRRRQRRRRGSWRRQEREEGTPPQQHGQAVSANRHEMFVRARGRMRARAHASWRARVRFYIHDAKTVILLHICSNFSELYFSARP